MLADVAFPARMCSRTVPTRMCSGRLCAFLHLLPLAHDPTPPALRTPSCSPHLLLPALLLSLLLPALPTPPVPRTPAALLHLLFPAPPVPRTPVPHTSCSPHTSRRRGRPRGSASDGGTGRGRGGRSAGRGFFDRKDVRAELLKEFPIQLVESDGTLLTGTHESLVDTAHVRRAAENLEHCPFPRGEREHCPFPRGEREHCFFPRGEREHCPLPPRRT